MASLYKTTGNGSDLPQTSATAADSSDTRPHSFAQPLLVRLKWTTAYMLSRRDTL